MHTKKKFPLSRFYFLFLVVVISFVILSNCSSKTEKGISDSSTSITDTAAVADERPEADHQDNSESSSNFIRYSGAVQDDVRKALETFSPFVSVRALARQYIAVQDSMETIRKLDGQPLTDPADTLLVQPFKEKAYRAILDYKKQMASGIAVKQRCPNLLELNRVPEAEDSSFRFLPKAEPSDFLSQGNFFLIGGAPFISKIYSEDNNIFTDLQGKPEMRFATTMTENASYLLTSVYCAKPGPIQIEYGPPLNTYEMGPAEVHGIGSLTHRFSQRVPVFFITENGLVPGHLLSVRLNLADDYNCGAGPNYIELACATSIESMAILAIYIPYNVSPVSCTVNRPSEHVWTADLNNDGIADLAGFSDAYHGEASGDTIVEELWFANINGTWKIIDWASDPDCT